MAIIQDIQNKRLEIEIEYDPRVAEDTINDNNRISTMLYVNFGFRIMNIALIIVTICYFLGCVWYIFCDVVVHVNEPKFEEMEFQKPLQYDQANTENFIT